MARVKNTSGTPVGAGVDPYGSRMLGGSTYTPEDEQGVSIFRMGRVAIGIRNAGATDITVVVVPIDNDIAETVTITVPANARWSDCRFNAIVVAGSTGHDSATTYYIYE